VSDEDVDLYRTPADVLRRERDHLKQRLKEEQAEIERYEELMGQPKPGLEALRDLAVEDARATAALLAVYRDAIAKVRK
jgi:hypothetical protein